MRAGFKLRRKSIGRIKNSMPMGNLIFGPIKFNDQTHATIGEFIVQISVPISNVSANDIAQNPIRTRLLHVETRRNQSPI
jgi:hypothetical protein